MNKAAARILPSPAWRLRDTVEAHELVDDEVYASRPPPGRSSVRPAECRRGVASANRSAAGEPPQFPTDRRRTQGDAALHPEVVSRFFRKAVKKAMLPEIRLHDLRHTHATLALQAGIHPKVVSERLGHATVSITLDTYSHAIPAMQEEAAALIAGLVFAGK